jgi:hypothetical protein
MTRFLLSVAMTVATVLFIGADSAQAGPWRKTVVRSSAQTCTSGNCGTSSTTERSRTVVRGSTATAQGVAELQAAAGSMRHHGGNRGFEGVGCGSTPEAALASCCNNGRAVVDQGVARGADGRYYACKRYSR